MLWPACCTKSTEQWDVPLMVTRGCPSVSFLYSAAETIAQQGKPAYVYYFGDWDPSRRDITRATEAGLREFAPDAEIRFKRVAVTEEQIRTLRLPTRPTKTTDSRAKSFEGESVEVDGIRPALLRGMVKYPHRSAYRPEDTQTDQTRRGAGARDAGAYRRKRAVRWLSGCVT
jgi:hypothetical protein